MRLHSENKKDYHEPTWVRAAYGPDAALALSRLGPAAGYIEQAVESFYISLMDIPAARAVLENLTPQEFKRLRSSQTAYLGTLLSPDLSAERHKQLATQIGLHHFCCGLSTDVLAEASVLYTEIVASLVVEASDAEHIRAIMTRRFQYDLITQIEVYALIQQDRLSTHEKIAWQRHTDHPLDFMNATLEILLESLSEDVIGVAVGNVKNGNYRHLLSRGRVPFGGPSPEFTDYPTVGAPEIQKSWYNEQALIANNVSRPSGFSTDWQPELTDRGIRSFGLFLMYDLQGAPKSLLMVCGNFPGYFLNEGTLHYWQQIADMIGVNFDLIERSNARRRHRLSDGLRFRQLLAQAKVEMHYQPIINPDSGRTAKVEALARLKDGHQTISPGMFLPAFGANQLRDLFDIGLARVIENLPTISDNYLVCSINLPPETMGDTQWLGALPQQLEKLGAIPQRISLEIVESALSDDKKAQAALYALKEAGYSIFLDDVGTGVIRMVLPAYKTLFKHEKRLICDLGPAQHQAAAG